MINREELNKLDREFPLVELYVKCDEKGIYESKDSYFNRNRRQALWLLDNSELLLEGIVE